MSEELTEYGWSCLFGLLFATAAVDDVEKDEFVTILETYDFSEFPEEERELIIAYSLNPPSIKSAIDGLKTLSDELKFFIAINLLNVVVSDGYISAEERNVVDSLKINFSFSDEQVDSLVDYVKKAKQRRQGQLSDNSEEKFIKGSIAALTSVGIPAYAIAASGSVLGLSAAGITSGLAALGSVAGIGAVGTILGVSSMLTGVGVVAALAVGSCWGVKAILGDSNKKIKKQTAEENKIRKQILGKNLTLLLMHISENLQKLDSGSNEFECLLKHYTFLSKLQLANQG